MSHNKQIKNKFPELLEQNPIVQVACNKLGVSRSTYYRWQKKSKPFKRKTEAAVKIGNMKLCDLAESKLVQNVETGNQRAIEYLLNNNHPKYRKNFLGINVLIKLKRKEYEDKKSEYDELIEKQREELLKVIELAKKEFKNEKF